MSTNKILLAGLAGGVTTFLLGWLVYGILLSGFFEANQGTATGVSKSPEEMVMWAMIVGNLAWGFLLALVYGRWANISTFQTGAIAGAVIGFLAALSYGFIFFATSNIMNLTATIVDPLAYAVMSAIAGGVVALVLGRGKV